MIVKGDLCDGLAMSSAHLLFHAYGMLPVAICSPLRIGLQLDEAQNRGVGFYDQSGFVRQL